MRFWENSQSVTSATAEASVESMHAPRPVMNTAVPPVGPQPLPENSQLTSSVREKPVLWKPR